MELNVKVPPEFRGRFSCIGCEARLKHVRLLAQAVEALLTLIHRPLLKCAFRKRVSLAGR